MMGMPIRYHLLPTNELCVDSITIQPNFFFLFHARYSKTKTKKAENGKNETLQ